MEGHEEAVDFYELTIEGIEEAEGFYESTMDGLEGPAGVDNEYMTMDAEQWTDDDDGDTYENADTLGIEREQITDSTAQGQGLGLRGKKGEVNKVRNTANRANTALPLPSRYMTIKLPRPNANKAAWKKNQLVFFRLTTVWLVMICLMLIGALVVLSLLYVKLAGIGDANSQIINLLQENNNSTGLPSMFSETFYIASTDLLTNDDLKIVSPNVLEKYMEKGIFFLYSSSVVNESYYNQSTWFCTC